MRAMRFSKRGQRTINLATRAAAAAAAAMLAAGGGAASAAVIWDGEAGTGWWYDSVNWNTNSNDNVIMPNTGTQLTQATEINNGYDFLGNGVVFDPAGDPNFTGTGTRVNPYSMYNFYLGNTGASDNKFTVRSGTFDLNTPSGTGNPNIILARNAASQSGHYGIMRQEGGNVSIGAAIPASTNYAGSLQIANGSGSIGIYEYHGGNLDVVVNSPNASSNALRVGSGNSTTGKFIVYNDGPAGHVRAGHFHVANGSGSTGILEMHLSNQAAGGNFGLRPIQAVQQLSLRNATGQSARLDLHLDEAPVTAAGVPQNLGVADYGTLNAATGSPEETKIFYSGDGVTPYADGASVTAVHGKNYYRWTIDYQGNINWSNADTSQITSVTDGSVTPGTDIVLIGAGSGQGSQWTNPTAGGWNAGTWSDAAPFHTGAPNGKGLIANFLAAPAGATSVTVDAATTVGHINLDNAAGYTIGGTNTITLDTANGNAHVNVYAGSHTIGAPLAPAKATVLDVAAGGALTATNVQPTVATTITKRGAGTLNLGGTQAYLAGTTLSIDAGTANFNSTVTGTPSVVAGSGTNFNANQALAAIHVKSGATATLSAGGGSNRSLLVNSVGGPGKLNLEDNKLIVRAATAATSAGAFNTTTGRYGGVAGQVQSGRGDGSWNGNGIMTAQSHADTGLTALAVALADETPYVGGTFGGQQVNAGDVLVMYTYGGDADLNGTLDSDDYFAIDSNFNLNGSVFGWNKGDFDYNGAIDSDDYFIIDSNWNNQILGQFPGSSGAAVTAVPEPAAACVFALAGAAMAARRRRRRHA